MKINNLNSTLNLKIYDIISLREKTDGGVAMEEKMFGLKEKMYLEMKDIKSNMATKDDLSKMATKDDLSRVELGIVRLEDKMDKNHKALYDGYKLTYEKLEALEEKVDQIEKKVEGQDVEIRVTKNAR